MKRRLIACFGVVIAAIGKDAVLTKQPFIGVFSNKQDEFKTVTLALNDDGKGLISSAGIYACPLLWKLGPTNNQITLTGSFEGMPRQSNSIVVIFDPQKKEIRFLGEESLGDNTPLYCVTNQIPKALHNRLLHFDGTEYSLTHGCNDTIFALSITNHDEDLAEIGSVLSREGVYCDLQETIPGGEKVDNLAIDERDVRLARSYATNEIIKSMLTVRVRKSGDANVFEVWARGKKLREDRYKDGEPVPCWVRP